MKLTKTLSAFGVLTVAIAALATGPVAAFAADDVATTDAVQTVAAGDSATGKLVLQAKDGSFISLSMYKNNLWLRGDVHASLADAEAASATLTVPKIGRTAPIVNEAGKCLLIRTVAGHNNKFWGDFTTCTGGVEQNFSWDTVQGVDVLRSGTDAKNSYFGVQPESTGTLFAAGSTSADFTGATGSAVVEGRLTVDTPTAGALIREDKPTFSGMAASGATIEVLDEKGELITSTTAVDGKWSAKPTIAFTQGRHTGTVRQVSNGAELMASYDFTYRVVQSVSVTSPALDGSVDVARPVFSGKGEPGAQVTILNNANDAKLVETTVDANGNWSQQSLYTLTKGAHEATATQMFEGVPTAVPLRFTYGAQAPVAPVTVTTPAIGAVVDSKVVSFSGAGQPGAKVVVAGATKQICEAEVGATGAWSCDATIALPAGDYSFTATQTSGSSVTTAPIRFTRTVKAEPATDVKFTAPADGSTVTSLKPVFKGTGQPGAAIRVHGTTKDLASTTVKADGTWSVKSTVALGDKAGYRLTSVQTPANGAAQTTDQATFQVAFRASAAVNVASPANGSTVGAKRPSFSGTGEAGSTITISGTTKVVATTTVKSDGTWSTTATVDLPNGDYKFQVKQVDVNEELQATTVAFAVYVKA
ncbi:Ig-like domain-containing protein [Plantibacter sp. YIM 135347]|uniref:Ig-like domain-containing protein n=1 Tax=Plantibacter sp. YIM 135347 TaxID=3423919 RepID=UPI003D34F548